MGKWWLIVKRELELSIFKKGYFFTLLGFFLVISFSLSMFSSLSDQAASATNILLIAYAISAIFSSSYLFEDDYKDSSLEQLLISGYSSMFVLTAKVFSYFIILMVALLITTLLFTILYHLKITNVPYVFLVFFLNSVVIASLTIFSSIITITIKNSQLVNFLISMPLLLVFLLYSSAILNNVAMDEINYGIFITDFKILISLSMIIAPISIYACSYILQKI